MASSIDGHHLLFGKGMVSDDTEHAVIVAQGLIRSGGSAEEFSKSLAWSFRWWLSAFPPGVGFATLRAFLKLWLGFSAANSGVFSAGNGPAMRSSIIGAAYGDDESRLKNLVRISTRVTHADPKAECGALAVAFAPGTSL